MFLHCFRYHFKDSIRNKDQIFWSLLFPLILGTFFYAAFNNLTTSVETMQSIPVAVVQEDSYSNESFTAVLEELSEEGDSQYLSIEYTSLEEATSMLNKGTIDGIIQLDTEIKLVLNTEGINQSILKGIIDSYLQMESMITDIAQKNPEQLSSVINSLAEDASYIEETSLSGKTLDPMTHYYFALIAMACMYGCFFGMHNAIGIQANLSPLGARRSISPTHKLLVTFSDFAASVTIQFIQVCVTLLYLTLVLKIDMGDKIGLIVLTSFVGSLVGVAWGTFIGSISKLSANAKQAFTISSTMLLCFLSGLMYSDMKDIIEHNIPILNRINPAALLTDAFYCLNIYDTYTRYFTNIIYLLIISFVLCFASFLAIRREKYASL